jgi:hypothetical protein
VAETLTGVAVRIDIEEELTAIARGECAACRIGSRHKVDSTCPGAKHWGDVWCARDKHDFVDGRCSHCKIDTLGRRP